ncbi:MAG: DUF2339 domain-containing protein, partial [FCB group bacterium]|nr:DUF2339 domain-containing protein [FCB group bacterium]
MNQNSENNNLPERVERLEKLIEDLASQVEKLNRTLTAAPPDISKSPPTPIPDTTQRTEKSPASEVQWTDIKPTQPAPAKVPAVLPVADPPEEQHILPIPPPAPRRQFVLPERMRSGEYWLIRVGIGLLLFGIVFLFKYSIDQGWITPWLRTGFGFAVGVVLIGLGQRVYKKRRTFATVLLGGGIATWYITGFAAFQLLELVSHPTAMGFMIAVTLSAFFMSVKQSDAILSIIGALGGFGTPFLLYTSSGNLPGLVIYTCLILAGAIGIFFFKGWRSLLWLSVVSGWSVFIIGFLSSVSYFQTTPASESWTLQGGVIFAWLCFWAVPITRELVWLKNPKRWAGSTIGFADKNLSQRAKNILDRHLHVLSLSSPLIGFGLSRLIWPDLSSTVWGSISFGVSVVYFLTAYYLRSFKPFRALTYTHVLAAISFFTMALAILLEGNTFLIALATEAAVLHLIARRLNDRVVSVTGHIIHGFIAYGMVYRLGVLSGEAVEFWSITTLTNFWVLFSYIITAVTQKQREVKRIYGLVGGGILAGIFFQTLKGNLEIFAVGSEALLVYLLGFKYKDRIIQFGAHVLFALTGALLIHRLVDTLPTGTAIFNYQALADLWCIILAGSVAYLAGWSTTRRVYLAFLIAALAALFVREFDNNMQFVLLAVEALAVWFIARTGKDRVIFIFGHLLFFILTVMLGVRLISTAIELLRTPIINWAALANILVIGAFVGGSYLLDDKTERITYRIAAHLAVLGWLGVELAHLANGQGWVSVSWGIYGAILLILGLRLNIHLLRPVGIGTLMLLVGKLFIVDLAELETIWRVLLFIGFGGVFLLLGYFFRSMWSEAGDDNT